MLTKANIIEQTEIAQGVLQVISESVKKSTFDLSITSKTYSDLSSSGSFPPGTGQSSYVAGKVKEDDSGLTFYPPMRKRLDPRISLIILVLVNATAFGPNFIPGQIGMVFLCAAVSIWTGRGASALRWCFAYAVVFGVSWLFLLFPNSISASFAAMLVMVKCIFCIGMFASTMIATTRVGELACALQRMRIPRHAIIALCVALRFFPTMAGEFRSVVEALRIRGMAITIKTVISHPVQVMEWILVPVMNRLSIVADELSNAAVVRGMDSDKTRSSFYDLSLHAADWIFLISFMFLAALLLLVKIGVIA